MAISKKLFGKLSCGTEVYAYTMRNANGMKVKILSYGGAIAEWYAQAQAFANTAVDKAPADVAGLATEGVAGCTIYVGGYHKALVKAASYVR